MGEAFNARLISNMGASLRHCTLSTFPIVVRGLSIPLISEMVASYDCRMFTPAASSRMFHIDSELDYDAVIGSDHRESWGSSQLYPAIVRVHTEMPPQDVPLHWHLGMELVYVR